MFGLVGIFSIPAIPLCIYALLGKGSSISIIPLVTTIIPVLIGVLWGNLDKNAPKFFGPIKALAPLGFQIGSSLNLINVSFKIRTYRNNIVYSVLYLLHSHNDSC